MSFKQYQELASRTLNQEHNQVTALANLSMGLAGEAGETVDYLKKILFHGHEFNAQEVANELGDVLWYIAGICTTLNISLEEVAQLNINKLVERYPDGFKTEDSVERKDTKKKKKKDEV